ncbi:MAG: hypothetical protein DBY16_10795 [Coprobacter sp.]|jgi:thioredoxin|nr:redoxin domain-containing protein [Barnesiella sp. GGCC_0306]PWM89061.1 MAG: hypothetical protein DBY16_10795 [Coprobacter sp.]
MIIINNMKQIFLTLVFLFGGFNLIHAKVYEVDEQTFKDEILPNLTRPVVLDFYATWCAPCRMYSPILERLSEEYEGSVDFYKVNVDENTEWCEELEIKSVPTTFIVYTSIGDYLRKEGVVNANTLKKGIKRVLNL